jgi:hypothetical protein
MTTVFLRALLIVAVIVGYCTTNHGSLSAQQPSSAPEVAADIANRLLKKAQAVVAGVQRELTNGNVRQDVIDKMQKLQPFMDSGKLKLAEALLDEALRDLGIDIDDSQFQIKSPPRSSAKTGPLPEFDRDGFTRIFDGVTLADWDGDPIYWKVEEGKLIGQVTPKTLLKKNSWIVWRGGLVRDFELIVDYRVSEQGNSGVGYRLAVVEKDPFSVRGPQADIHGADMFTGICYEENGRRLLAARGQSTWIAAGKLPRLIAQLADAEELQSVVRKEDWNRYRLVVKGNDAQHYVNGVLMSEVHDHDEPNRMHEGMIGVQVHVGPPMKIEYRDMFLKRFGEQLEDAPGRDRGTYRPGSLLEREHPPTFKNLAEQALRLSSPNSKLPHDGKTDLEIVTGDLAIVRSDLLDVKMYGASKPRPEGNAEFDLIVIFGKSTIRVPAAGHQLIGKPLDKDYRVRLVWDKKQSHYRLTELSAVEQKD